MNHKNLYHFVQNFLRYHTMDCLNLHEKAQKDGIYWANAVYFAVCNAMLGISVLQSFDSQLKYNIEIIDHKSVSIYKKLRQHFFEEV
jgi:hypothetical protein